MPKPLKSDAERLADANDLIRNKQNQIRALEKELRARTQVNDTAERWRTEVFGLDAYTREPPKWLGETKKHGVHPRKTPLFLCSDGHGGEPVAPDRVGVTRLAP